MKLLRFLIPLTLIPLCIFIYYFQGSTWGKSTYEGKFKAHLEEKYHDEFVIDSLSYEALTNGTYHGYAYPMSEPELVFYIGQLRTTKEIVDEYVYTYWSKQAESEITPLLNSLFPDKSNHIVEIYAATGSDSIKIESTIPHFKDYVPVHLYLSLKQVSISAENKATEFERVHSLLTSLKEREITIDHFEITYQNRVIRITYPNDIDSLTTPEELEDYLTFETRVQ